MPRVLIADDDQLVRFFLSEALRAADHEVVAAHDGPSAIERLNDGSRFDVVVTDYSMPGADGVAVIEHAIQIDPTLPCIIVSAYRDVDLAMRAMTAGAVGFLPKPFTAQHLLTVVASALERRRMAEEVHRLSLVTPMLERFTLVLGNTLESKDCATEQHAQRLVSSADAVAAHLDLDQERRLTIRLGACLHDIGKVGIPEHLLRKPGPLSADEMAMMRLHPDIGATILEEIEAWMEVRLIVRHHHEHWNGAGYPLGLSGRDIPLGARIVNVVDAFDVMRTGRPYARALSIDQCVDELVACRGAQFDPDIVDAFLATLNGASDYHGLVDSRSDLDLIARRADRTAAPGVTLTRSTVGESAA